MPTISGEMGPGRTNPTSSPGTPPPRVRNRYSVRPVADPGPADGRRADGELGQCESGDPRWRRTRPTSPGTPPMSGTGSASAGGLTGANDADCRAIDGGQPRVRVRQRPRPGARDEGRSDELRDRPCPQPADQLRRRRHAHPPRGGAPAGRTGRMRPTSSSPTPPAARTRRRRARREDRGRPRPTARTASVTRRSPRWRRGSAMAVSRWRSGRTDSRGCSARRSPPTGTSTASTSGTRPT